jgi:hypothetical protein
VIFVGNDRRLRDERAKQVIDVWKTIVGVQMHFNEIGMRVRGLFVTILVALFASIGFLLDKKLSLQIWRINIQFATIVPIFGIFGTMLFYLIDRYWFHRLLKGSVNHAIKIEKKYGAQLPELSLSDEIGKESFFFPKGVLWLAAKMLVTHDKFLEKGQLHSDGKLEIFYKSMMVVLAITSIILAGLGGVSFDKKRDPSFTKRDQITKQPLTVRPPTAQPSAIPAPSAVPTPPPTPVPSPTPSPTAVPPAATTPAVPVVTPEVTK